MSDVPTRNDLDHEVQGLPLTGYGARYAVMRNLVLTVVKPTEARRFLARLQASGWLDFGGKRTGWPERAGVNIGFTSEGLRALGVAADILDLFRKRSPAFSDGAPLRAARHLGDAGVSAVELWDDVFRLRTAHVWIAINANDMLVLEHVTNGLSKLEGASGLSGWRKRGVPDGEHLLLDPRDRTKRYVHFGLRDNLTQPSILPVAPAAASAGATSEPLPAGDLLLGYRNSQEANIWASAGTARGLAAFVRNGSFGILRQIEQDEDAFGDFLATRSAELIRQGYAYATRDYLKAKLCGRWPGGAPVQPHQTQAPHPWQPGQPDVDFKKDKEGWGCPFGAHIRRANPRMELLPPVQRTLFRRSIPYGPVYPGQPDGIERGLVGVFFCGHVDEQFELLVSEWLEKNPLGPRNAGRAKDPLSGHHDEPDAAFHIPMPGGAGVMLKGFGDFVRTRGTLYALFPSQRALRTIAGIGTWETP